MKRFEKVGKKIGKKGRKDKDIKRRRAKELEVCILWITTRQLVPKRVRMRIIDCGNNNPVF